MGSYEYTERVFFMPPYGGAFELDFTPANNYRKKGYLIRSLCPDDDNWSQCMSVQASVGLYYGVRAGLNMDETLAFVLGWATLDIMRDDILANTNALHAATAKELPTTPEKKDMAPKIADLFTGCTITGCSPEQQSEEQRSTAIMQSFLAPYQGKVLLLLMGREGCPGTIKATDILHTYASTKPEGVAILRLDVPLAGEELELSEEWDHPYPRNVDTGRRIADALDFFFYPTFYLFGPDGTQRYSGGCDPAKLDPMVKEILAEQPGQPKKSYNLPMPKVGETAPAITGTDLKGQSVTLTSLKGSQATLFSFRPNKLPLHD